MTIEEFNNTAFFADMEVVIHTRMRGIFKRTIATVDLDQCLIGVYGLVEKEVIEWYRCENCEIVEHSQLRLINPKLN